MRTIVTAVAVLMACAACKPAAKTAQEATRPAAIAIKTDRASQEEIARRVDVTGTLAAWEEATVSLEAEGRVVELRADLGDKVKKGATLARIAPENYSYRKAQADAELAAAEADLSRIDSLVQKDMATKQQFDEAKRRAGTARANADLTRKQLSDTTLRAPFDGTVARRMVNAGEYVRSGTAAFQIVQTSPLKLKLEVSEKYVGDVKVGDVVEAECDALPGKKLAGTVVRVGPAVAADTRSFPVEARFDNADEAVKPGTFARATITTETRTPTVLVPETAVTLFAGTPRVFVVDGGAVHERTVELAGRHQGRAMVVKGLSQGDTVAVSGVDALSDGAQVTVQ